MIYSDECYIEINLGSIINRVRRFKSSDPYNSLYIRPKVKHVAKLMIWGCFCSKGVGYLRICDGNMNSQEYLHTLENYLLPSVNEFNLTGEIFHLDDSAPCHRTKRIIEWHENKNINKIEWPGNSPDLNPIENLWHILKYKLKRTPITSKQKLIIEAVRIWRKELVQEVLEKLALSMNKRLEKVIKAKGGVTKY